MQIYSKFSSRAISLTPPEISSSQCMNWPCLWNLHPQVLETGEPCKVYLAADLLCLLAVVLFGKTSHWACYQPQWSMTVSKLVNKTTQSAFHGPKGRTMMLTMYFSPKTGWACVVGWPWLNARCPPKPLCHSPQGASWGEGAEERKYKERLVDRDRGKEKSLNNYCHRQNRFGLGKLIHCKSNQNRVMRNKPKS